MARTYKELQDEVLAHGFAANRYRERVKRWINDALSRVARRIDLPFTDGAYDFSTVAGTASYALPAAFVRLTSLRIVDSDRDLPLLPYDRDDLDLVTHEQGRPTRYALSGQQVTLWPTPDAAYSIELRFQASFGALVGDTDPFPLPDDYEDIPIAYALWKAYRSEDDMEMARDYERQWRDQLLEIGGDMHGRDPNHVRQVGGLLDVWGDDTWFEPDLTFP